MTHPLIVARVDMLRGFRMPRHIRLASPHLTLLASPDARLTLLGIALRYLLASFCIALLLLALLYVALRLARLAPSRRGPVRGYVTTADLWPSAPLYTSPLCISMFLAKTDCAD